MSSPASAVTLPLILRLALRDLRGGLAGFGIFLGCIALGVAAIVGVGSMSHGLSDGLAREGRQILGGDVAFSLIHRELDPAEQNWLSSHGGISTIATLRAMARRENNESALIELKAVDATYPVAGDLVVDPPLQQSVSSLLAPRDGVYGIVAEAGLAARLDLKPGDRLFIGDLPVELRATLVSEPDMLATGLALGPRVILSQDALAATGLIQPGSLVRWTYRVSLTAPGAGQPVSDTELTDFVAAANKAFPQAGWEVRTRNDVSPQFTDDLRRFTQFLTLVGLTALIVGGVGIANAVRAFIDRRRPDLAVLKSLGATGAYVFGAMLTQVVMIAILGIAIGLVVGAALPFAIVGGFGSFIPFPIEAALYPRELAAGAGYGVLTALVFSLGPLGRAHDISVSALFRDAIEPGRLLPRARYVGMTTAAAIALVVMIVCLAAYPYLALVYCAATLGGFIVLRAVGAAVMGLAARLPRARRMELRLAVANIHRPGALTPSIVLSLGLGLALLVTLTLIDGNVRSQIDEAIPGETPSFFFLDLRSAQTAEFDRFMQAHAPDAKIERAPMMRGRVVALNKVPVEKAKAKDTAAWVLEGDRGITFAATVPEGSQIVAGQWWPEDYAGPPLVSIDAAIADGLGLGLGDSLTVNVLGRDVTAKIANLRKVNWRSFGINFVFVFSPDAFEGAPFTALATAAFAKPDQARDLALLKQIAAAFPTVTTVLVKDVLDAVDAMLTKLAFAIRGASGVALAAAIMVLAGALAAGERTRLHDAVVLKTLGATRMRLLAAFLLEYALLGLVTAIFAIAAGSAAAYAIVIQVMKLDAFTWLWSSALSAAFVSLALTIGFGLVGTWRVLGQKPAAHLREL
ncbi:MAG TPA: FtsX-like permease family protein [Beijerinckiaceae bacterium]|nr:FtsX-like permease family protein [Beijerinckiaceae bacterium]